MFGLHRTASAGNILQNPSKKRPQQSTECKVQKVHYSSCSSAELRNLQFSEELSCWTVRCGCCHEDLPCDEEFYSQDGRLPASWCKACRAEKFRSWYRRKGSAMRKAAREAAAS